MLFLSHEDTLDAARVRLLAHDMFHHWNPRSTGPTARDDSLQWFTEGFTVYYEAAIPLRAATSFACRLPGVLESPSAGVPNVSATEGDERRVAQDFTFIGTGYGLPYSRGATIALWADDAIRARSGGKSSLGNVMFDQVNEAHVPNPPELSEDRVFGAFAHYLEPEQVSMLRAMEQMCLCRTGSGDALDRST